MSQDNAWASAIVGGLGALSFAYFSSIIDQSYGQSLRAFENLHAVVDYRLEQVEEAIYLREYSVVTSTKI